MHKGISLITVAWLAIVLAMTGCRDSGTADAPLEVLPAPAPAPDTGSGDAVPFDQTILENVYALMDEGDADAALALLEEHLAPLTDGPEKGRLFSEHLAILLMLDRVDDARQRYLAVVADEPVSARQAHGVIEHHLEMTGDLDGLARWARQVLEAGPPEELRAVAARIELDALQRSDRMDEVVGRLDDYAGWLEAEALTRIVAGMADRLIAAGQLDAAERLQRWLAADERPAPLRRQAKLLHTDLLVAREAWDQVADAALAAMAHLDDRAAADRFDHWCRGVYRARQADAADRLAERVLAERETFPAAALRAARWRLSIPKDQDNLELALGRFEELAIGGVVAPGHLPMLLGLVSSYVFSDATPEQAQRFLVMSDALPWPAMPEGERGRQIGMLLDISFTAGDFKRTEALLREGVPGHDERWHEVMINKVLAHQAQEAGRTDEAVERFRRFMQQMAEDDQENLIDPVSGHRVTGSMIQALNARRIGDILKNADRSDEAAAAYAEAVQLYTGAIEEVGAESREAEWIREQLAALQPPAETP